MYHYFIHMLFVNGHDRESERHDVGGGIGQDVTRSEGQNPMLQSESVDDAMSDVAVQCDIRLVQCKLSSTPVLSDYTPLHALTAIQLVGTFAELTYGPHHLPYTR
jgi:hypothetical protein